MAATVGVGAVVVGLNVSASAGGEAEVWIDGPLVGSVLEPGEVTVTAHATAEDRIDHLVLLVDGTEVADSDALDRSGKLVHATFTWTATEGEHVLVVEQEDGAARSAERVLFVGDDATGTPSRPSATPTPTPTPTPSPTPTPTPSPTPTPTPTPTEPTEEPPVISEPSTTGGPLRVCTLSNETVTIAALIENATEVDASFDGRTIHLATTGGSSWSATVTSSGDLNPGVFDVLVEAVGPGGLAALEAGTVTVNPGCPKD